MNLRVDLMLDVERRSSSLVSSKGVLRIASVVIPLLLLGFLGIQLLFVRQLGQDLQGLNLSYESAKPQQEKAKALIAQFQSHRDIQSELAGWRNSRVAWNRQMAGLMEIVPVNAQLNELNVSQTLQLTTADKPSRRFSMTLRGKAVGDDAEQSVRALEGELLTAPAFTSLTEKVSIPVYGADMSPQAGRDDRVFQVDCQYAEQAFQ